MYITSFSIRVYISLIIFTTVLFFGSYAFAQDDCLNATQENIYERFGELESRGDAYINAALLPVMAQVLAERLCVSDEYVEFSVMSDAVFLEVLSAVDISTFADISDIGDKASTGEQSSCFDLFQFGTVIPYLEISRTTLSSGTKMHVSGILRNINSYPVVDVALFIKIRKKGDASTVDQFFVVDRVSIDASAQVPVSFTWNVPTYIQGGEYEIVTFVTTSKQYNLLGVPFTDSVVGTIVPFEIIGEQGTGITIDSSSVTVDGREYFFEAYPLRFDTKDPLEVSSVLVNTTNTRISVPITWKLYRWDQQRRENLITTESGTIVIEAGEEKEITYTITDASHPMYLLVAAVEYKDTQSIINIPVIRTSVTGARISFPGVTTFPFHKGEQTTLFACMHSMATPLTEGNEVVLTLLDREGNVIHTTDYIGPVVGAVMGVKSIFVPSRNYDYVEFVAQLFTDNVLVEDTRFVYDCNEINSDLCNASENQLISAYTWRDAIGVFAVVAILITLGMLFLRLRKDDDANNIVVTNV